MKDAQLIQVSGKTWEFFDSRETPGPTLILFNGFRMPFDSWQGVIPRIAEAGRVVAYNRAGVGRSSKATTGQTARVVIEDFRALAAARELRPPYGIVAHSLGGLYANYYARAYPDEVAAIVFVDAPHPDEIVEQKQIRPPAFLTAINEGFKALEKLLDPYKYSEDDLVLESIGQIKAIAAFPPIPVTVITGTQKLPFVPQESFDVHLRYQKELLGLSPDSRQAHAERSGHFPQITEPELVAAEIRAMLTRRR